MDPGLHAQLTSEYGELHFVEIAGKEYAYRALTLEEVNKFEQITDNRSDLEDLFVQNGIVYPLDFDLNKLKAGHISVLAEAISKVSGMDATYILGTLNDFRKEAAEDIIIRIKAMIIAAMPSYSDEYINTLTIKEVLRKLVLSEEILTIQRVVNGIPSEQGIRLEIAPIEEVEKPKKQKSQKVDKETLLRRIRSDDIETAGAVPTLNNDYSKLLELDEELLSKAAGQLEQDDPIARKLRKAMGG